MSYSYLALGDSYTIGELVPIFDSFPYQAVQLLRKKYNVEILAPEIVAKTGWTTDELLSAIDTTKFLPSYDFVTLLIGVNNQYRGRSVENYKLEFEQLLQKAIRFAKGISKNVFVLSIPDWGATPFAEGKAITQIATEIDSYNLACMQITLHHQCQYIEITRSQRADGMDTLFLASDLLHPSVKEYAKWAELFARILNEVIHDKA